jgi:hypothetical protein
VAGTILLSIKNRVLRRDGGSSTATRQSLGQGLSWSQVAATYFSVSQSRAAARVASSLRSPRLNVMWAAIRSDLNFSIT